MINISTKKVILVFFGILLCLSLLLNGWLIYQVSLLKNAYEIQLINKKNLDFTKMFVEDVLMASTEIDFDTRLALESAVRNLNDQQVLGQWQKFTKAVTKEDASKEAKILLRLLIDKTLPY